MRGHVDGQLADEGSGRTVLAHRADGLPELVVQHRHRAVAVVERTESVRNADHAPGLPRQCRRGFLDPDLVANRQNRLDLHARMSRNKVGCLRRRRPGVIEHRIRIVVLLRFLGHLKPPNCWLSSAVECSRVEDDICSLVCCAITRKPPLALKEFGARGARLPAVMTLERRKNDAAPKQNLPAKKNLSAEWNSKFNLTMLPSAES